MTCTIWARAGETDEPEKKSQIMTKSNNLFFLALPSSTLRPSREARGAELTRGCFSKIALFFGFFPGSSVLAAAEPQNVSERHGQFRINQE